MKLLKISCCRPYLLLRIGPPAQSPAHLLLVFLPPWAALIGESDQTQQLENLLKCANDDLEKTFEFSISGPKTRRKRITMFKFNNSGRKVNKRISGRFKKNKKMPVKESTACQRMNKRNCHFPGLFEKTSNKSVQKSKVKQYRAMFEKTSNEAVVEDAGNINVIKPVGATIQYDWPFKSFGTFSQYETSGSRDANSGIRPQSSLPTSKRFSISTSQEGKKDRNISQGAKSKNTKSGYKSMFEKFFSVDKNATSRKTVGEMFKKFKKKKINTGVKEAYRMEENMKYFENLNSQKDCSNHFLPYQSHGFRLGKSPHRGIIVEKADLSTTLNKTERILASTEDLSTTLNKTERILASTADLSTTLNKIEPVLTSTARKPSSVSLHSSFISTDSQDESSVPSSLPNKSPGYRNSLEEGLKMKPSYSPHFLKELQEKYDRKHTELDRKIAEEEIRKEFYEKKTEETKQEREERIVKHMEITQVDVEDIDASQKGLKEIVEVIEQSEGIETPVEEEEIVEVIESSVEDFVEDIEPSVEEEEEIELPEITLDMEEVILRATRSRGEVLVDSHNIQITKKDIDTLQGLNWLNDEIINFYLQMIVDRSTQEGLKVYAPSTFFYPKMMSGGQPALKRWTRRVDIFSKDLMLIPVHLGMHWCLAVVDFRKPGVYYYDSMGGNNYDCLTNLLKYLQDEYKDKKGADLDVQSYEAIIMKDIPQQMNGSDCGMFTCKFAEYISKDAAITFTQQDMPYYRKRMVWEIVSDRLLHP